MVLNGAFYIFSGITSFIFTKYGQGFFLLTSSEYQRISLSARMQGDSACTLELAEGMRPEPPPEPETEPEAAAGAEGGEEQQAKEG